ncbi:hypothetical protein ACLOJK_027327, partial [Asimina triloba]
INKVEVRGERHSTLESKFVAAEGRGCGGRVGRGNKALGHEGGDLRERVSVGWMCVGPFGQ